MPSFARTLLFSALAAVAFGIPQGALSRPDATANRVVYVARGLSDEDMLVLTSAVAAEGRQGVVLIDSDKTSLYAKAFLAAYRPSRVIPVGGFPDGIPDLDARLGVSTAPVVPWTRRPPEDFLRVLFPRIRTIVVCPAAPRRQLLQAACLAGAAGAPLVVVHGDAGETEELGKHILAWRAQQIIFVGGVSDLDNIPSDMSVIRLEDEQAVADACLSRLGRADTVVVANPADRGKSLLGLSTLAPWAALQKHAALLLTNSEGTDAAEIVRRAAKREPMRRADAVLLVADFQAIPPEKRQNPSASEKEPTIEVEPLTPHGTEPYTFAVGRLIHDDPAVPLLMLARERLLSESHGRRRALVASNSGGGLPLLETFSRNTVSELRNAGYETTASFGNDVNAADLRKALAEQDLFLWEGHHSVLVRDYEFPSWDEPTRPSLVFLQSCLALKEDEAGPMLRRGAVAVISSPTRMYSGSGGACSLAFFDALLYDGQSIGGALRQSKNFMVAYSLLKEKMLTKASTHGGAGLRAAEAFSLWGDPTLHLPTPETPDDALPPVRCHVEGNGVTLTAPLEMYEKVTAAKFEAEMPPNGRLAALVHREAGGESESLAPFLFAEVRLPEAQPGRTPILHTKLSSRHWVFLWDERRGVGYLLVSPRSREDREFHFHVEWRNAETAAE
jgi:Peptidase family C25